MSAMIRGVGIGILLALMIVFFAPASKAQDAQEDTITVPAARFERFIQERGQMASVIEEQAKAIDEMRKKIEHLTQSVGKCA